MQAIARRGVVTVEGVSSAVYKFMARAEGYHRWADDGRGCRFEMSRPNLALWREIVSEPVTDADGTMARLDAVAAKIAAVALRGAYDEPLWRHQIDAVSIVHSREIYAFFDDMGTGKSREIVTCSVELYLSGLIDRVLVVSTNRGWFGLVDEFKKWLPKDIKCWLGRVPKEMNRIRNDGLVVGIATPGSFQSKSISEQLIEFCQQGTTAVMVDESQNFKGWSTKRVENLLKLVDYAPRRYIFTGEPTPNGLVDLFAQFYFLDRDIIGHKSLGSYKKHYCIEGSRGDFPMVVDHRNIDGLTKILAPHCRYIKITDCKDMPERIWSEALFEPDPEQVRVYKQLKRNFVAQLEVAKASGEAETVEKMCESMGSLLNTLAQVACGWFYHTEEPGAPRKIVHISDARVRFMFENLIGNDKCVVWARFHEDLAQISQVAKEMGIDAVEFSGRVSNQESQDNYRRFVDHPSCKLFFGTVATGGESINLQIAHRMIYHSNTYNWGQREQSERRIWRAGQTEHCDYVDLIGFPIDRMIRRNAIEKQSLSEQVRTLVGLEKIADQL